MNDEPAARRKRLTPDNDDARDMGSPPLCEIAPPATGPGPRRDPIEAINQAIGEMTVAVTRSQRCRQSELMGMPKFSGEPQEVDDYDVREFIDQFTLNTRGYLNNKERALELPTLLKGEALAFYGTLSNEVQKDFQKVSSALIEEFSDPQAERMASLRLHYRKMGPNETVTEYAAALRKLGQKAYPRMTLADVNERLCEYFLLGLTEDLRGPVLDKDPKDFKTAVNCAKSILMRRQLCAEEESLRRGANRGHVTRDPSQGWRGQPRPHDNFFQRSRPSGKAYERYDRDRHFYYSPTRQPQHTRFRSFDQYAPRSYAEHEYAPRDNEPSHEEGPMRNNYDDHMPSTDARYAYSRDVRCSSPPPQMYRNPENERWQPRPLARFSANSQPTCFLCAKKGHVISNCPTARPNLNLDRAQLIGNMHVNNVRTALNSIDHESPVPCGSRKQNHPVEDLVNQSETAAEIEDECSCFETQFVPLHYDNHILVATVMREPEAHEEKNSEPFGANLKAIRSEEPEVLPDPETAQKKLQECPTEDKDVSQPKTDTEKPQRFPTKDKDGPRAQSQSEGPEKQGEKPPAKRLGRGGRSAAHCRCICCSGLLVIVGLCVLLVAAGRGPQYMLEHKDSSPRLIRWDLCLQDYDIETQYKTGRKNQNTDAMSRIPLEDIAADSPSCTTICVVTRQQAPIAELSADQQELQQEQARNPLYAAIIAKLQGKPMPAVSPQNRLFSRENWEAFRLRNGLLYYLTLMKEFALVLTDSFQKRMFTEVHSSILDGHLGPPKTLSMLQIFDPSYLFFTSIQLMYTVHWSNCKDLTTTVPSQGFFFLLSQIFNG